MYWFALVAAGLFEVVWSYYMKMSDGFRNPLPSVITIVTMLVSFGLLSYAMRSLPLGTAYVIWTGIGAVGAFIAGIMFLGEQLSMPRIIAAVLIVAGMTLMKISTPS